MDYLQTVQDLYKELGELRGLEATLKQMKVPLNSFQEKYDSMVRTELISQLNQIKEIYSSALIGTPEAEYLNNLLLQYSGENYGPKPEILDKEIDFLNLTTRSRNSLMAAHFYHVGQVAQMKEAYFIKLPNVGRKTLNEVKEEMNDKGLGLDMDLGYKVSENSKLFDFRLDQLDFYSPIWISANLMNFMESKNINFLGELVQHNEQDFSTLDRNEFYTLKDYLENRSMSFGMQIPRHSIIK